jgi:hypothetical protein
MKFLVLSFADVLSFHSIQSIQNCVSLDSTSPTAVNVAHLGTEDQNKRWADTQNNVSEITVPVVCPPHMECYGMEPRPWQRDSDDLLFESSDGLSNPIKNEKSG